MIKTPMTLMMSRTWILILNDEGEDDDTLDTEDSTVQEEPEDEIQQDPDEEPDPVLTQETEALWMYKLKHLNRKCKSSINSWKKNNQVPIKKTWKHQVLIKKT